MKIQYIVTSRNKLRESETRMVTAPITNGARIASLRLRGIANTFYQSPPERP